MTQYKFILRDGAQFEVELEARPRITPQQKGRISYQTQASGPVAYIDSGE